MLALFGYGARGFLGIGGTDPGAVPGASTNGGEIGSTYAVKV